MINIESATIAPEQCLLAASAHTVAVKLHVYNPSPWFTDAFQAAMAPKVQAIFDEVVGHFPNVEHRDKYYFDFELPTEDYCGNGDPYLVDEDTCDETRTLFAERRKEMGVEADADVKREKASFFVGKRLRYGTYHRFKRIVPAEERVRRWKNNPATLRAITGHHNATQAVESYRINGGRLYDMRRDMTEVLADLKTRYYVRPIIEYDRLARHVDFTLRHAGHLGAFDQVPPRECSLCWCAI